MECVQTHVQLYPRLILQIIPEMIPQNVWKDAIIWQPKTVEALGERLEGWWSLIWNLECTVGNQK